MKVVYIAGPLRDKSAWQRHKNILKAEEIGVVLWQLGLAVIVPHKNTEFLDGAVADHTIADGDLAMIARCDAVVILTEWERSEGTKEEIKYCLANNIPTFVWNSGNPELQEWVTNPDFNVIRHLEHQRDYFKELR